MIPTKFLLSFLLFDLTKGEPYSAPMSTSSSTTSFWHALGDDVWFPMLQSSTLPRSRLLDPRHDEEEEGRDWSILQVALSKDTGRLLSVHGDGEATVHELGINQQWNPIYSSRNSSSNSSNRSVVAFSRFVDDDDPASLWAEKTVTVMKASLSPSGRVLAVVERFDSTLNTELTASVVTVLSLDTKEAIGSVPDRCFESDPVSFSHLVLEDNFLVIACDGWDEQRGLVQVYALQPSWQLMVELTGDEPGDKFGSQASLDATLPQFLRLAVSAPGFNRDSGLVRVYDLTTDAIDGGWYYQQVGTDLLGNEPGDGFGSSLSLSHTGEVAMAIGALGPTRHGPERTNGRVEMVSFARSPFQASTWIRHQVLEDETSDNNFGSFVHLTADAQRLVVASRSSENEYFEKVAFYERSGNNWNRSNTKAPRLVRTAALSSSGYVLATLSVADLKGSDFPWGRIRAMVDYTPFCSITSACGDNPFLDRKACRFGLDAVAEPSVCESLFMSNHSGIEPPCTWVTASQRFVDNPTTAMVPSVPAPPSSPPAPALSPSVSPVWERPSTLPPKNSSSPVIPVEAPLLGCVCDRSSRCVDDMLAEGEELVVCVQAGDEDQAQLLKVSSFYLQQGSVRFTVIDREGTRLQSASSRCFASVCQVIVSRIQSSLLTKGETSLVAAGTVDYSVTGANRKLRTSRFRSLTTDEKDYFQGYFSVVINLDRPAVDEQKAGTSPLQSSTAFWISLVTMVGLLLFCLKCAFQSIKQSRCDDDNDSSVVSKGSPIHNQQSM